jgi:hypothetical protein
MDFKNKYLKYKLKYLNLKQNLNGGIWRVANDFGRSCKSEVKFKRYLELQGWFIDDINIETIGKLSFKNKEGITEPNLKFNIIRKTFDGDESRPDLVAMAGLSFGSFCGSAEVITQNIEKLRNKFKNVYIINLNPFKIYQEDACKEYGSIKRANNDNKDGYMFRTNLTPERFNEIYGNEIKLDDEIAGIINEIITEKLGLRNVHILGKCQGGSVSIQLVSKSDVYKALYLAVPGSPSHITPLYKISKERLEKMNFIFGWNDNDNYAFNFTLASINEKAKYDEEIGKLEFEKKANLNCQSYHFTPGNKHEINPELISKIANS